MKKHYVYILYDVETHSPIYVGYSRSLKRRINSHLKTKIFTGVIILGSFDKKEDALLVESHVIKFISMFSFNSIKNGLYDNFKKDTSYFNNKINQIKRGIYG